MTGSNFFRKINQKIQKEEAMAFSQHSDRPLRELGAADPEASGFDSQRLRRIGTSMQKYIDTRMVPGTVTLVARHGRIVQFESRGLMDLEANKPMADDTIFRIMSMTKPIVCAGLMMLYEEGHFLLDQPISRYLPSYEKMVVKAARGLTEPATRQITIRDCLTHTAGLSFIEWGKIQNRFHQGPPQKPLVPGRADHSVNQPPQEGTLEQTVELLAKVPLNYHPGTDWEYNPSHDVVGVLIEKISGQNLQEFLQERILDPLKMVDTHFYLPAEKANRLAAGYRADNNEWGKFGLIDSPATSAKVVGPKSYFSAAGGLLSTAADYARFAQMLLNGGILDGARILGRKTIELMTTNHTGGLNIYIKGAGYGYGLGFFVRTSLAATPLVGSLGSYGWGGAYCTSYFADPREDLFGLQFTQIWDSALNPDLVIRNDFERMVYQALVGE
jgi:CubicO group peptidase (beta-lactamase class C family)